VNLTHIQRKMPYLKQPENKHFQNAYNVKLALWWLELRQGASLATVITSLAQPINQTIAPMAHLIRSIR
jgi:hypothetical protein